MTKKKAPEEKVKTGRRIKYDPERHPQFAKALAIEGLTNKEIAKKIGIVESTFQDWVRRFPAFSESIKEGKAPADAKVEMALYRRAMGYEVEETRGLVVGTGEYATVKIVSETRHISPDTRACMFWLKNRKAATWQDKQEIEHSGQISWVDLVRKVEDRRNNSNP